MMRMRYVGYVAAASILNLVSAGSSFIAITKPVKISGGGWYINTVTAETGQNT